MAPCPIPSSSPIFRAGRLASHAIRSPNEGHDRANAGPLPVHTQQRSFSNGRGIAARTRRWPASPRYSAGTEATRVRPEAIVVMRESGIDISGQSSKTLNGYLDQPFDLVITVCDTAADSCPMFLGAKQRLHWSFPDPSVVEGSEAQRLDAFRTVRDAIRDRIESNLVLSVSS